MTIRYIGFDLVRVDRPAGERWMVAVPYGAVIGFAPTLLKARAVARQVSVA